MLSQAGIVQQIKAYDRFMCVRTAQNKQYLHRAMKVLGWSPSWAWLGLGSEAKAQAGGVNLRVSVLVELGRYKDDTLMRLAAAVLCLNPPASTKLGVAMARRRRIEGTGAGGFEELTNALWALVKSYLAERLHMEPRDAVAALESVASQLRNESHYWIKKIREEAEDQRWAEEEARRQRREAAA